MRIFISFPYTHSDQSKVLSRVAKARAYCLELIKEGHTPFSPAIFAHDLIINSELDQSEQDMTFKYWNKFCYNYLDFCDEIHILKLNGWEESAGVKAEIQRATEWGLEIKHIELGG